MVIIGEMGVYDDVHVVNIIPNIVRNYGEMCPRMDVGKNMYPDIVENTS
jgi:hypothetical protein